MSGKHTLRMLVHNASLRGRERGREYRVREGRKDRASETEGEGGGGGGAL